MVVPKVVFLNRETFSSVRLRGINGNLVDEVRSYRSGQCRFQGVHALGSWSTRSHRFFFCSFTWFFRQFSLSTSLMLESRDARFENDSRMTSPTVLFSDSIDCSSRKLQTLRCATRHINEKSTMRIDERTRRNIVS